MKEETFQKKIEVTMIPMEEETGVYYIVILIMTKIQ